MNLDLSWSKFQPCLHQTALSASILDFKWVYENLMLQDTIPQSTPALFKDYAT